MPISILLFAVGLVLLITGGDWFVDGATGIARRFRLPDIIVGATVVSIGTTLPEVMVSTTGALSGSGAMAYGNAIGSIICNTALIAAISITCNPGPVNVKSMKTPAIFFFLSAAMYCVAAYALGTFRCALLRRRLLPGRVPPLDGICDAGYLPLLHVPDRP